MFFWPRPYPFYSPEPPCARRTASSVCRRIYLIIEEEAFAGADGFSQAVLPDGILEIGPRAFADSGLASVNLPASLVSIADDAFEGCEGLSVSAPEGSYAYDWCIEHELILLPLEALLTCSAQSAVTGEPVVWTASVSGGKSPRSCLLTLTKDGEPFLEAQLTPDEPFEMTFIETGLYQALLTVSDGLGAQASASAWIYVFDGAALTDAAAVQTGYDSALLSWTDCSGADSSVEYFILAADSADGELNELAAVGSDCSYALSGLPHNQTLYFAVEARAGLPSDEGTGLTVSRRSERLTLVLYDAQYELSLLDGAYSIEGAVLWPDAASASLSLPAQIDGCPVVRIGEKAFTRNGAITSITIPGSVKEIDSTAFYGCGALATVSMADSVETIGSFAFAECPALSNIGLSAALKEIGDRAFQNDPLLTSVSLPSGLISLGARAFYGTGVTELSLPASLAEIGVLALGSRIRSLDADSASPYFAVSGGLLYSKDLTRLVCAPADSVGSEYTAPDALASIEDYAFAGCSALSRAALSANTISIGEGAFKDCASLSLLENTQNIEVIGDQAFAGCAALSGESFAALTALRSVGCYAFSGCASLGSLSFPDTLTALEEAAFINCTGLTSVSLPPQMSKIGAAAFYNCTSLRSIQMPDRLTGSEQMGIYVFYGCSALQEIAVPAGVTGLGEYSFHGCSSLTAVSLPDGLLALGFASFFSCPQLAEINFPSSLRQIGSYAFSNGSSLKELALPSGTLDAYAFGACSSLEKVTFTGSAALTLGSNSFLRCTSLSALYLPDSISSIASNAFDRCDQLVLYVKENSAAQSYLDSSGFAYELAPSE